MSLRIATQNVNGFNGSSVSHKSSVLLSDIEDFDVFLVQETHYLTPFELNSLSSRFPGCTYWNTPDEPRSFSGTAVFVNPPDITPLSCDNLLGGRAQRLRFTWADNSFVVWNVYAPPRNNAEGIDRVDFLNQLWELINAAVLPDVFTIVGGDFNSVENGRLDRKSGQMWSEDNSALSFFAHLNGAGIYDTWRIQHPVETLYTYNRGNSGSRLDRFYCDMGLAQFAASVRHIEPLPGITDHNRVVLTLKRPNSDKWGRGYFKLNPNLLAIPAVQAEIHSLWANWRLKRNQFDSLSAWWDVGKIRICEALQRAAKVHSASRRSAIQQLEDTVDSLTESVQSGDNNSRIPLELAKVELLDLKRLSAENRYVQQRIEEISADNGNPEWYRLVKNRRVSSPTLRAALVGDQLITEPIEVVSAAAQFYQDLYSKENCNGAEQDFFLDQIDQNLSPIESDQLENYFSTAELSDSLKQMKMGKSPGPDGLPVEFYRIFWNILRDDFTEVINSAWLTGKLPLSMRSAVTSILYKKGDSRQLKNYRPVSLLNVDYKLLSKTLTLRVRKVMIQLICPYQACGVSQRQMSDNLLLIRLLQLYSEEHNWPVFFTAIDQQKAFDMVDHGYMQKVLTKMNFGSNFIRLVEAMYTDITTRVKVNGKLSEPVAIHKGIRQGCALSMLLYVIALEPLLSAITKNRQIIGIKVPSAIGPDVSVKFTVYADDITLITADQYSVEESFALLSRYQSATGAKINRDKTEIVCTPNSPAGETSLIGVPFSATIRVLGMRVGNDDRNATWNCLIQSCRDAILTCPKWINTWLSRKKFLHTYVYSKLWHIVAADPPTKVQLQRLNRVCYSFLFGSDYRPVIPATLALPINKGGIDLIWPKLRCEAFRLALLRRIAIAKSLRSAHLVWAVSLFHWIRNGD